MPIRRLPPLLATCITLAACANAATLEARFTPCLGARYRPGAWLRIQVRFRLPAGKSGVYVPELRVSEPTGGSFTCRLPPIRLRESGDYRLRFWAIAGDAPPSMAFALTSPDGKTALGTDPVRGVIRPLAPGERLVLRPGTSHRDGFYNPDLLPEHAAAYESADALVVGSISWTNQKRDLPLAAARACSRWVAAGGVVLVLDRGLLPGLLRAAAAVNLRPGPTFPFVLPAPKRIDEVLKHPPARRLGRGLIIDLSGPDKSHRVRLGRAAWQRLRAEFLPPRSQDLRLARLRYQRLDRDSPGWPSPPRPPAALLARWFLAWIALVAACLAIEPVRRTPLRAGLATCVLSCILALGFARSVPVRRVKVTHARTRLVGECGTRGPTLDEDIWFASPFATGHPLRLAFRGMPPPRLLACTPRQLRLATLLLRLEDGGGSLEIHPPAGAGDNLIRRGYPLLLSRRTLGAPLPASSMVIEELPGTMRLLVPDRSCGRLQSAWLRTRAQERHLQRFDGRSLPPPARPDPLAARTRIAALLSREHAPGAYGVLMGWEPGSDRGTLEAGVLRIYGIAGVVRQ